jgi:hypothetical protein
VHIVSHDWLKLDRVKAKDAKTWRPPNTLEGEMRVFSDGNIKGQVIPSTAAIALVLELLRLNRNIASELKLVMPRRFSLWSQYNLLHLLDPTEPRLK